MTLQRELTCICAGFLVPSGLPPTNSRFFILLWADDQPQRNWTLPEELGDYGFWPPLAGCCGQFQWGRCGCLLVKTSLNFVIKSCSLPFYNLTSNRSVYTLWVEYLLDLSGSDSVWKYLWRSSLIATILFSPFSSSKQGTFLSRKQGRTRVVRLESETAWTNALW